METFAVDIDPEQVVRWVKAEYEAGPVTDLRITARLAREVREIPVRRELHFGDSEREDLSEVATVAALEIAPVHVGEGWLLSVIVEDEVGPRISDRGPPEEGELQIDFGTFYKEFIRPGRGNATVFAEAEDATARAHLTRLIDAMMGNRHGPGGARPKG